MIQLATSKTYNDTSRRYAICHILLLILYTTLISIFASYFSLGAEDWLHYSDFAWGESWQMAQESYKVHNPRIGELLSYFIGAHAWSIFHLLQPSFILLAVVVSFRLCTGHWIAGSQQSLLVLGMLMIGIPATRAWIWWFTANLNWFYPITLALLFFAMGEGIFRGEFRLHWAKLPVMIPLAFIIGMSNENTSFTALVLYLGAGIYWGYRDKSKLTGAYMILGIIMILGALLFYTAPGIKCRSEAFNWSLSADTLLWQSILHWPNWLFLLICYWRLLLPAGLLLILAHIKKVKFMTKRTWILLVATCLAHGVLMATPSWGAPRSYWLPQILFLILLAELFYRVLTQSTSMRSGVIWLAVFACCASTWIVSDVVIAATQHRVCQRIEHLAQQAKSQGSKQLIINESDLSIPPLFRSIPYVPQFIVSTEIKPELPLIPVTPEQLRHTDTQKQGDFPNYRANKDVQLGKRILNIPVAKRFGLDSIICISGPEPSSSQ